MITNQSAAVDADAFRNARKILEDVKAMKDCKYFSEEN